jgi:tRNA nucleotidyltransferase/poly(A) polymerase
MDTYLVEWDVHNDNVVHGVSGHGDIAHIEANSKVEAFAKFYEQYKDKEEGVTVENAESGNPLGFTDEDMKYLTNKNIKPDVDKKSRYIHIRSIERFGDPVK